MKLVWWIGWGIMFAAFIVLDSLRLAGIENDIMDYASTIIKFSAVVSCLVYVLIYRKENSLLVIAMSLTLLADTLLFWTNQLAWGVFVFCFAQMFHTFRLTKVKPIFLLGYGLAMLAVFVWLITNSIAAIYALAFIYGSILILNVFLAWKYRWVTFVGFLFFLACDINVALHFLSENGEASPGIAPIASFLVIIFYMPSQILLVNGKDEHDSEKPDEASDRRSRRKSQSRHQLSAV
jgi:hypothetical protein